jgi:hypothetical protein
MIHLVGEFVNDAPKQLTNSSSFNVARGTDVNPAALRFVAAIVFKQKKWGKKFVF